MITVQQKLSLTTIRKGRKRLETRDTEKPTRPTASVPRISRLMALAIKYQGMLDRGEVASVTELAKLCHVTQPRMTQILNLNFLSPSIQEQLLFLPEPSSGKPTMHERGLRFACTLIDWESQASELSQKG